MTRLAKCDTGETIDFAADDVPQRMARQGIERQQHYVGEQHQRAHAYPKAALKPERLHSVVPENEKKDEREVKKITMQVLQYKRKCRFSPIAMPTRFADSARGWIKKECPVIGFAVVVTGGAKTERRAQDQ